eukprot:1189284-Prorocentrum_minimum.AAC.5
MARCAGSPWSAESDVVKMTCRDPDVARSYEVDLAPSLESSFEKKLHQGNTKVTLEYSATRRCGVAELTPGP